MLNVRFRNHSKIKMNLFLNLKQRYTYRVLQTIQMKLKLLCVWAELAVLGRTKTALKFKYEIVKRLTHIQGLLY